MAPERLAEIDLYIVCTECLGGNSIFRQRESILLVKKGQINCWQDSSFIIRNCGPSWQQVIGVNKPCVCVYYGKQRSSLKNIFCTFLWLWRGFEKKSAQRNSCALREIKRVDNFWGAWCVSVFSCGGHNRDQHRHPLRTCLFQRYFLDKTHMRSFFTRSPLYPVHFMKWLMLPRKAHDDAHFFWLKNCMHTAREFEPFGHSYSSALFQFRAFFCKFTLSLFSLHNIK